MTRADIFKLLGGAAVLAVIVAFISPPTTPVPTVAGDWRKQLPVKTGTPAPAAPAASVPAAALAPPPPPARPVAAEASRAEMMPQPAAPPPVYDRDDRVSSDDIAARRYRQGYDWAQRNGIDDEPDCYRRPGDPFTDGCLAALRDGDDDRDPGVPPGDGRFRRYGWDR